MTARATSAAKLSKRLRAIDPKAWWIAAAILVGAFAVGYGATALSFSRSGGIDVITVPDVRDLTLSEARRALIRSELELVVADSFPNPTIPAGTVLAQSPLPGQEVSPGREVEVFLSSGVALSLVPPVAGMPLALATRALQTAGFDVLVSESEDEGVRGRVIGTEPAAGSPVALPSTINLVISAGAARFGMPGVIGMMEADARTVLEDAGLEIDDVVYERTDFGEPGSVISQEPAPGESVDLNTPVRLRVNARETSLRSDDGRDDAEAIRERIEREQEEARDAARRELERLRDQPRPRSRRPDGR